MDDRTFERRILGLIFRSNLPLTPVHIAYHFDIPIAEARQHLDRLIAGGVLELDSDDRGNILYVYPLRPPMETLGPPTLPRRRRRRRRSRTQKIPRALVPVGTAAPPAAHDPERAGASAVAAAALSLFLPGVGQIYTGRVVQGICWMFATAVGYLLFLVPGLILHICCIVNAALGPPRVPALAEPA
jgi:hypothetical protein